MRKKDIKQMKCGNEKIDSSCGITCLPTHVCKIQCPGCYAKRPEIRFPSSCLPARNAHLEFTKTDGFVKTMIKEITCSKVKTFRPHESGDFYSQEYVNKWTEIASALPHINFYTYTKTSFDFSELKALPNFNLIESITPLGFNFGDSEYCQKLVNDHGYKLCPCRKGIKVKCMKECNICETNTKVCFLIH